MNHRWLALTAVTSVLGCQRDIAREQMPAFGSFCVRPAQWDNLLTVMREFARRHGLELHGGIEKRSDGLRNLNVYLARGYSYWWGDDLDFWVTSNPHVEGQTTLGGISKKPWSKADLQMAHDLLAAFTPLQCNATR